MTMLTAATGFSACAQAYNVPDVPMPRPMSQNYPYRGEYEEPEISRKHQFKFVLSNDSTFVQVSRIDVSYKKRHFMNVEWHGAAKAVIPSETKSISRIMPNGREWVGIPADTCWLFRISSGKINTYSFLDRKKPEYTIAIQKGDGPVVALTVENFLSMLTPDERARWSAYAEFKNKFKTLFEVVEKYNKNKKPSKNL